MRFVLSFLQGSVPEFAFCTRHNSPLSKFCRAWSHGIECRFPSRQGSRSRSHRITSPVLAAHCKPYLGPIHSRQSSLRGFSLLPRLAASLALEQYRQDVLGASCPISGPWVGSEGGRTHRKCRQIYRNIFSLPCGAHPSNFG